MSTAEQDHQKERAVFDNDDDDSSDSEDDDVTDDDNPPNPNNPSDPNNPLPQQQTLADPNPNGPTPQNPNGSSATPVTALTAVSIDERRPLAFSAYDESRRLFQRLWTDDDEIKILQGFFEFTSRRGTTFASHQYDTGPFYEDIKTQLNLEFTKNQLIEKLRRLKKKYRNCVNRMRSLGKDFSFKSAHERAVYDIARNIWSANVKRSRDSDDDEGNNNFNSTDVVSVPVSEGSLSLERKVAAGSKKRMRRKMAEEAAAAAAAAAASVPLVVPESFTNFTPVIPAVGGTNVNVVEETVKSCLSPLFKELISSAIASPLGSGVASGVGGMSSLDVIPLGIRSVPAGAEADEKWKKQQIMELEVYLKRIELVRDHVKATLEELRSTEG